MRTSLSILCVFLIASTAVAQVRQRTSKLDRLVRVVPQLTPEQKREASILFDQVKENLASSAISDLSGLLNRSVHLALPGVEQGQYSKNQATQLLTSFFAGTRVAEIRPQKIEDSIAAPYFSAILLVRKGEREQELNLYISLARFADSWVVGHFSLY